ncbi:hypothetical protein Pelo_17531 [Pelomyxa schiedti]|nr:hypothetical protein Pelo_17531 [Pelomyxa schiedti]
MDNNTATRFYCVKWRHDQHQQQRGGGGCVMITFGVSLALMSLTHEMMWWAERPGDGAVCGANGDCVYGVVGRGKEIRVRDRATWRQGVLFGDTGEWDYLCSNGMWLVLCRRHNDEVAVIEVPRKSAAVGLTSRKSVVVRCDGRWNVRVPQFTNISDDYVSLLCHDAHNFASCEIVLVDLVQTRSSGKLCVLTSAVIRVDDLPPQFSQFILSCSYFAFRTESGAFYFVVGHGDDCTYSSNGYITVEGVTGKLQPTFSGEHKTRFLRVVPLDQSRFCTFDPCGDAYEVWDVNDTSKPVRNQKCMSGWMSTTIAQVLVGMMSRDRATRLSASDALNTLHSL